MSNRKPPAAGKGRPKGAVNKLTASAKTAFQYAFDTVGGPEKLAQWALENQTEFYKLYARLIPTEVAGEGGGPVQVQIVRFSPATE